MECHDQLSFQAALLQQIVGGKLTLQEHCMNLPETGS